MYLLNKNTKKNIKQTKISKNFGLDYCRKSCTFAPKFLYSVPTDIFLQPLSQTRLWADFQ